MRFAGSIGSRGCLVPIQIEASTTEPDASGETGRPSIGHFAQIDTGREECFIRRELTAMLGLEPRVIDFVETPFGTIEGFVYRVRIAVLAAPPPAQRPEEGELHDGLRVYEIDLLDDDFSVILGRSGLKRLRLEYDGTADAFTVTA